MGAVTKKTKLAQHRLLDITIDGELCQGCGACAEACWFNLPRVEGELAVIDSESCMRCPICSKACPEGAIRLENRDQLPQGLAVAAKAVLDTFDRGKVSYLSFANDISTMCDCAPVPGEKFAEDIGIFAGHSALSVDAGALKYLDVDHLREIHGVDCTLQTGKLEQLGEGGSSQPKLVEV